MGQRYEIDGEILIRPVEGGYRHPYIDISGTNSLEDDLLAAFHPDYVAPDIESNDVQLPGKYRIIVERIE